MNDTWIPPDPGIHQQDCTESDLDDICVIDLATHMRELITDFYANYGQKVSTSLRNLWIDDEAVQELTSEPGEVPQ